MQAMSRYRVDFARSDISVTARPQLEPEARPKIVDVSGEIELAGLDAIVTGSVRVTLDGDPRVTASIPIDGAPAEIDDEAVDERVLRGGTSVPAGLFARGGVPLVNPTLLFRWRMVLVRE